VGTTGKDVIQTERHGKKLEEALREDRDRWRGLLLSGYSIVRTSLEDEVEGA
jgi:hypothetical protein